MARPGDWQVLDLDGDPVPGDPFTMRSLAQKLRETSEDARRAERDVRSLAGDGALLEWLGLAGEEFKAAVGEFPGQLAKVRDSYDRAADAVTLWAGELEGAQSQADRALEQGRQAREEIERARAVLQSAEWSADSASRSADRLQNPAAGAEPPDAEQVRQAVRNAQVAASRVASARGGVEAAERKLDLARRLALQAAEARDEAGDRAAREVRAAAEAGIEPTSFWDKVKSAAEKVWEILVIVAKVVVAVLGIVVLIIGGPLAWAVFAAALLVLADTVMKWVQGRATALDLVWALVDCIPGTKGITTAARLLKGAKGLVSSLGEGRAAVKAMTAAVAGRVAENTRVVLANLGDDAGYVRLGGSAADDVPLKVPDRFAGKVTEKKDITSGRKRKGWRNELNKPEPNTAYFVDGKFLFVTDDAGRVSHAQGQLDELLDTAENKAKRADHNQRRAGGSDRLPGDEGGHTFAATFGGPGEKINLTAMSRDLNQAGRASWHEMESEWRRLLGGEPPPKISVDVDFSYPPGSTRPRGYDVRWSVDGGPPEKQRFINRPSRHR